VRRIPLSLAVILLLTSCGNLFTTAAAVVNERTIEEDRFVRELEFLLADPRFAQQIQAGDAGEAQRRELARQYLTFLIHQTFVDAYAEDHDLQVEEAELDGLLQQQVAQLGGRASFDRLLRQSGTDEGDVRRLLERQVLRQRVAEAVVADRLGDDELRSRYDDRLLEFSEVTVAHILVTSEREAERIADQATPSNFAALARRFSEDTASASNGGELGPQRASDLVEPFARAALRIPVGEIGGPVQTDFGFHVIHVLDRRTRSFEEVRESLIEESRGQVFTEWLLERLGSAEIRVNPRYGAFDEATGAVIARRRSSPAPAPSVQLQP
jgi:parvulin-like peptidyl-prolyl isomerase